MTCDLYRLRIHPVCKHSHTLRRWGSGLWGHRSAQSSLSRTRLTHPLRLRTEAKQHTRPLRLGTDGPKRPSACVGKGTGRPEGCCAVSLPRWQQPLPAWPAMGGGGLATGGDRRGHEGHLGAGRGWVPPSAHALGLDPSWVRSCEGTWLRCRAESSPNKDTVRVANTTVGKPAPAWRARQPRPQRPVWPPIPVRRPPAPDALPSHHRPLACFSSVLGRLRGGVGAPWGPGWASGQHADFGAPGLSDRVGGGDSAVRAACSDRLASGSRRPHPQVERGSMPAGQAEGGRGCVCGPALPLPWPVEVRGCV